MNGTVEIALPEGYNINDRLKIEKILHRGELFITYLCLDIADNTPVVAKEFFPAEFCKRGADNYMIVSMETNVTMVMNMKARFIRQAISLASIHSDSLPQIREVIEGNGTAYCVMERIEGLSLAQMVERRGAIAESRCLRYINRLGEALSLLHDNFINHYAVSPHNVILRDTDKQPVLLGLSFGEHSVSEYTPVECYNRDALKDFSVQSDVYSLAATAYFILTGLNPPKAIDLFQSGLRIPDSVSPAVRVALTRALSTSKHKRHETIQSFLDHLNGVSQPEDVEPEDVAPEPITPEPITPEPPEQIPPALEPPVVPTPPSVPPTEPPLNPPTPPHIYAETPAETFEPEYYEKKSKAWIWIVIAAVVLVGGLVAWWLLSDSNEDTRTEYVEDFMVYDLQWDSPFGKSTYTGPVTGTLIYNSDGSLDYSEVVPHGEGTIYFLEGDYEGNVYEGSLSGGHMQGHAVYTFNNGDTFDGRFVNDSFSYGRYTDSNDGSYFEGSFDREGNQLRGAWYDRYGKLLERVDNSY